jgi:hypothetical protein
LKSKEKTMTDNMAFNEFISNVLTTFAFVGFVGLCIYCKNALKEEEK